MPLKHGSSRKVVARNIHEMFAAGHPHAQAVAAALHEADESKAHKVHDMDLRGAYELGRSHGHEAQRLFVGDADGNEIRIDAAHPEHHGDGQITYDYGTGQQNPNGAGAGINPFGTGGNNTAGASTANPNAYQYGGAPGGAAAAQNAYATMGTNARAQAAPQLAAGGINANLANEGQNATWLSQEEQGQGPNLAGAQLQQATDQSIAAQQAAANSSRGSLAGAGAQRGAAQQGAMAQQQNAQNSATASIQQQQMAAQQLGQLQGQIGQQQYGLSNANAGLQESQNQLGAQTGLGYAQLGQQVGQDQLQAQMAQQQNALQQAGVNTQNAQFNAGQKQNFWGSALGALGGLFGDADFEEPGRPSNGWTLREEAGGPDHDPFILALDRQNGRPLKLATQSLSPAEMRQVRRPHGAGPLDSPQRDTTVVHDLGMQAGSSIAPSGASGASLDSGGMDAGDLAMAQAGQSAGASPPGGQGMAGYNPFGAGVAAQRQFDPMQQKKIGEGLAGGDPQYMTSPNAAPRAAAQALMRPNPVAQGLPAQRLFADADFEHPATPGTVQWRTTLGPKGVDFHGGQYGDARIQHNAEDRGQGALVSHETKSSGGEGVDLTGAVGRIADVLDPQSTNNWAYKPVSAALAAGGLGPSIVDPRQAGAAPPSSDPDVQDPASLALLQKPGAQPGAQGAPALPPAAGAGGPARTGFVNIGRPGETQAIAAADSAKQEGMTDAARADQHAIEDATVAHGLRAQQLGEDAAEQKQRALDDQAEAKRLEDVKSKHADELAKLGEDYGFHPTAMQNIRFTIAKGLGALGTGLTKGAMPNFALQEINQTIERDLDRQKQQIESKKGQIAHIDSALADAYRRTGNMDKAMALVRGTIKEKTAEETLAYGAASQDAAVSAQAKILAADQSKQAQKDLDPYFARVTTGGAGGGDIRAKVIKRAQELVDKGKFATVEEARRFAESEYGLTGSGGLRAAEKGAGANKLVDLAGLEKSGNAAVGAAGLGSFAGHYLPAGLAPESASQALDVDAWNSNVVGGLKSVEPRLSGDALTEQADVYKIKSSDPDALKRKKVKLFLDRVGTGEAIAKGKVTTNSADAEP